ncbi:Pus7, partial [Symbiodinium microadriaticum]
VNTFGLEVVSGDVVLEYSGAVADASEDRSSAEDDDAVVIENGIEDIADSPARKQSVHVVTPDDIADRKFTMSDVVLPLVSHDSIFPTHPTGEYIHTLLAESGISMEMFNAQKGTLGGAYRRVVGFPQDMTWRCQRYSHGDEEIATTELAALKPPSERSTTPTVSGGGAGGDVESGDGSVDKKYLAAVIEFSLPSGTYATMLLRELMKFNTNSSHHAALTAANEAEDSLNQGSSEKLGVADLESANKSDDASDAMASPSKRLRLS